jgi:hypothetical protein
MARRTVELGTVQVEGLRLSTDTHLILLHVAGMTVELPVSPGLVPVVKDLYGERAKLALVVEDFKAEGTGESWRDTSRKFFQPDEKTGPRAKPKKEEKKRGTGQLQADRELLAKALEAAGGVKKYVGTMCGKSAATYHSVVQRLDSGRPLTPKMREDFEALVERKADG